MGGDSQGQKELYQRFAGRLMTLCMRYCKNRDDAEDVLQDAFVKIYLNLSSYKGDGSFEGWMKRIAINTAIKHYKKNLKFGNTIDLDDAVGVGTDNHVLSGIAAKELMALIRSEGGGRDGMLSAPSDERAARLQRAKQTARKQTRTTR